MQISAKNQAVAKLSSMLFSVSDTLNKQDLLPHLQAGYKLYQENCKFKERDLY